MSCKPTTTNLPKFWQPINPRPSPLTWVHTGVYAHVRGRKRSGERRALLGRKLARRNVEVREREVREVFRPQPAEVVAAEREAADVRARQRRRVRRREAAGLRRRINIELNFPPNFEELVLGCIDADFINYF